MNTNGNTYTVIYSTILVVLVAAILAFVALGLQDKQNENIKLETISKLLDAASQSDSTFTVAEDADVLGIYAEHASDAFFINASGEKIGEMNTGKENVRDIQVTTTSDLKKQNDLMKKIEEGQADAAEKLSLPVYVFDINGKEVTVLPCYGAGLWGPIWGYVAIDEDGMTIDGAVFDHKGETPGLGAKIAEDAFYTKFLGKTINLEDEPVFTIAKASAITEPEHSVDAISGATITSQALGKGINLWLKNYRPYLSAKAALAAAPADSTASAGTLAEPEAPADGTCGTNENVEE